MQKASYRAAVAAFLVAMFAAASSCFAVETVRTRAAVHDGFGRVVFEWPEPVVFTATVVGARIVVHFNRPLSTNLMPLTERLDAYINSAKLEHDRSTVTIRLARPVTLQSAQHDKTVVLDLRPVPPAPAGSAAAPPEPQPPSSPPLASPAPPAAAASAGPPPGGPAVPVRAAEHAGFSRLVFDWTRHVDYEVERHDNQATIRFAAPGRIEIGAVAKKLPKTFEAIAAANDGGRATVTVDLAEGARIRHFRDGTKIAFDAIPGVPARPAAEPKSARAEPARRHRAPEPARTEKPAHAPAKAASQPAAATPPVQLLPRAEAIAAAGAPPPPPPPGEADRMVAELDAAAGGGPRLSFIWPKPTAAAMFERAGALWVVFDRVAAVDVAALANDRSGTVRHIDQLSDSNATVLRLRTKAGLVPVVRAEGTRWLIDLQEPAKASLPTSIDVRAEPVAAMGPRVFLPVLDTGVLVQLHDPEVGDRIDVVPLSGASFGVNLQHEFSQFIVLRSAQGVAVVPKSDGLTVQSLRNGVEIGAKAGLLLSNAPAAKGAPPTQPAIFRFAEWRGPEGHFTDTKQKLQTALVNVAPSGLTAARRDLARFYFANGQDADAEGVLARLAQQDPRAAEDKSFRALRGAVNFNLGRYDAAERDLGEPGLAGDPEAALWRGRVAAAKSDWARARDEFAHGMNVLPLYPPELRAQFHLAMAKAHFGTGDLRSTATMLTVLAKEKSDPATRAEAELLRGRLEQKRGDEGAALAAFTATQKSGQRPSSVRASVAAINAELESSHITRPQAIERLEALRFAWRGDRFELELLQRLGELYFANGDPRNGMIRWREAVSAFPDAPETGPLKQEMGAAFERLFLDGEADRLPPVEALGLFYDFRDLTPKSAKGDEMIRKLADRLVAVDLLGRAADLLDYQANNRLQGEERAKVATRLAVIRLLDHKPEAASEALRKSAWQPLPPALAEERRLLQARALIELGQFEPALKSLAGDSGRGAEMLRADVNWRSKNWPAAAKSLASLLGDRASKPEPLEAQERQILLQLAVALSLSDDKVGLMKLREDYAGRLEGSKEADAFKVVTSDIDRQGTEFRQLAGAIANVKLLEAFMDGYRDKLQKTKLSSIN